MTLNKAILKLSNTYIDDTNDWYNWREINENKLPQSIILPDGNQYVKNIALKQELNKLWTNTNDHLLKFNLIEYYIQTWGGIYTNDNETLIQYTILSPNELISRGKKGIASWSKAICVHNPEKYAIYDARVSASLNCLQIIHNTTDKFLYPILSSRNNKIVSGNQFIKEISSKEKWKKISKGNFYDGYLKLLSEAAIEMKSKIATIEMLLFAKAEDLINEAFPINL